MPAFLKDIRRRSSLFGRKESSSSLSLASNYKTTTTIPEHPIDSGDSARRDGSVIPSPDSVTPPPSDVDSAESRDSALANGTVSRRTSTQQPNRGNRMSVMSMSRSASSTRLADPLAPRITSFPDRSHTSQKLLLLAGCIGDGYEKVRRTRGTLYVTNESMNTPSMEFPINEAHFKVLVLLQGGKNVLRFDFAQRSSQVSIHSGSGYRVHTTHFCVENIPANHNPPLHLAMLVAKDSDEIFDAPPHKIQREGNNLDVAIRKFRMAAVLWQAFVAEQMRRQGFGQRTFRFEEEWASCTVQSSRRGLTNEVKVHVVRLDKTMAEIRDLNIAQQHSPATKKGELHAIATEACQRYFRPPPGCPQHVAAMFLDTHWDTQSKVITGHAALGSGGGDTRVGIFGSHALHAYPTCLEDVLNAFHDATQTDTNYVANDVGRSATSWEAANVGLAAHLHEVGHVLGLPHQDDGIMAADYTRFNRTFCVTENYRRNEGERAGPIINENQETYFHRLDALRLRYHDCLHRPDEKSISKDSVQLVTLENHVWISSGNGIAWIEFYDAEREDNCKHWVEYLDPAAVGFKGVPELNYPRNIRTELPPILQKAKKIRVEIFSVGGSTHTISDWDQMVSESPFKATPKKIKAYRHKKLGASILQGSEPQEVLFDSFHIQTKLMNNITVYHGDFVDGMEFCYEDGTTQLFGKRGGKPGGSKFPLNTRNGEQLFGFVVRAGAWIDGIAIMTTSGRTSPVFGNPNGGSQHRISPPPGYSIAGISGSCGAWLDGFQVIISR